VTPVDCGQQDSRRLESMILPATNRLVMLALTGMDT